MQTLLPSKSGWRTDGGLTLIEVLVSVVIITAMIVIFQVVVSATTLARNIKNRDLALKIASHKMEELRAVGYSGVSGGGTFSDDLLTSLPGGAGQVAVTAYNDKTKQVSVTVTWMEKEASKSVSLTTLLTEVGGLK